MQKEELIRYWVDASEVDYRAMNNLYLSKDYVWALFLGHLIIEDRKSTRLNSSHTDISRMPSSA